MRVRSRNNLTAALSGQLRRRVVGVVGGGFIALICATSVHEQECKQILLAAPFRARRSEMICMFSFGRGLCAGWALRSEGAREQGSKGAPPGGCILGAAWRRPNSSEASSFSK